MNHVGRMSQSFGIGALTLLDHLGIINWYPSSLRIIDPEKCPSGSLGLIFSEINCLPVKGKTETPESFMGLIFSQDPIELVAKRRENTGVLFWI